MESPDLLERFAAQSAAFERTFIDDDWSRLERYFTSDAIYEVLGPGGERWVGRAAVLAALRRAVNNFDRLCDSRALLTIEGPVQDGAEIRRQWSCTFTLSGAPNPTIDGSERAVYRGELIELLQEKLTARSGEALNRWVALHGSLLRKR
ncbi:MAG TPA: hypothetical protein VII63_05600 [Caulobacteraceae bacterium]